MFKSLALAALSLVSAIACHATGAGGGLDPNQHPSKFCSVATDEGYPGGVFRQSTGGCSSATKEVTPTPGRNGLKNNLTFYAMGLISDPSKLQRVSFILNVNNEREAARAHAELARVAVPVASTLLGTAPKGLDTAVQEGMTRSWSTGAWRVEVITDHWQTKLGHDITVRFSPATH
jgi:hypothetical protein